jgi:hypothetical protein
LRPKCERDRSRAAQNAGARLALHRRIVVVRIAGVASLAIVITLVTSGPVRADPAPASARLRLIDSRLHAVVAEGREHSASFRALLDQLEATDVVVYVECARLRPRLDGALTFLTAAAGVRYVVVRIALDLARPRQIAILGHELQHALEIAGAPDIVSARTMAAAYERFGFTRNRRAERVDFDTVAAIATGVTIWRELGERASGE